MTSPDSRPIVIRLMVHILRAGGCLTLLPYLAQESSQSFATCLVSPRSAISGIALAGITFLIIIGYGNFLAGKRPGDTNATFWLSSIAFYSAGACSGILRRHDDLFQDLLNRTSRFPDAFIPKYQPDLALGAVGDLTPVILAVWMPVAVILSIAVFACVLKKHRHGVALSEQEENGIRA